MTYKRILPSGKTTWEYRFDIPGEGRKRAYKGGFATKKAAIEAEAARRIELKMEAEAAAKANVRTLRGVMAEFFSEFRGSAKTLERYRQLAGYLDAELTGKAISDVTALDLHREWKRLAESGGHTRKDKDGKTTPRPLSAKTVRNICGVVSSAFGYALLYELVQNNPAKASQPPRITKRAGHALPPEETRRLAAAATLHWEAAYIELAAASGCRRGELLALEWGDLNGAELTVGRSLAQTKAGLNVKGTKTGRTRHVALPASVVATLEAHRKAQDAHREHFGAEYRGNLIFANPDGTPLRPDSVSSAISALCKRLKMPKGVSLHTLRHTHGSQLIAQGVPITEVSRRLGHSSTQTTMDIYAHALPDRDEEVARKWEEFQGKDTTKETRQ